MFGVGVLALVLIALVGGSRVITGQPSVSGALSDSEPDINQLARNLFSEYVFAFEVTSVLLVIAVVGTVILARRPPRPIAPEPESEAVARGDAVMLAVAEPTPTWYLVLAAVVFAIGAVGLLVRRNPLVMFMCVELMLNAVNLSFVAFAAALDDIAGQTVVFFVLVVAAAEVVVGLGIIVSVLRRKANATADDLALMKG